MYGLLKGSLWTQRNGGIYNTSIVAAEPPKCGEIFAFNTSVGLRAVSTGLALMGDAVNTKCVLAHSSESRCHNQLLVIYIIPV